MAAIPIPGMSTDGAASRLWHDLQAEGIQVPVGGWPVPAGRESPNAEPRQVLIRISAQQYNEAVDYHRLAVALERRFRAGTPVGR
jgi:hypothetical protein